MSAFRATCVVGARPNFVKMAALLHELQRRPGIEAQLIHTGQHFSPEMSENLFRDLELPRPDVHLGVAGGAPSTQIADIMRGLEAVLTERRPDVVIVVGDVNSTVAAALVASKFGIKIAHVEAGLRSFDRSMPEEINRMVTDVLSDYLFATEPSALVNLRREGIPSERVFLVGNVMIDTLLRFRTKAEGSQVLNELRLTRSQYIAATLHRPSNVDDPERLDSMLRVFAGLSRDMPVVFPVHPRTRQRLDVTELAGRGIIITPPLGYLDFMHLMSCARLVMTDSGGIQEETTILGVPCLTLRENTERPVTITNGTNQLVGVDPENILRAAQTVLANGHMEARRPELWDGRASERIVNVLERIAEGDGALPPADAAVTAWRHAGQKPSSVIAASN